VKVPKRSNSNIKNPDWNTH